MLFCCLKRFSSNFLLSQFPFILHLIILYSFKFKSTMLKLPTCFYISQSISYLHQNKFICSISFLIELLFIFHIPSALHIALNKILQNIRLHLIKFFIKLSFLFFISSNCDALTASQNCLFNSSFCTSPSAVTLNLSVLNKRAIFGIALNCL